MFFREIIIKNVIGIQARLATIFIQKANEFKSDITIEKGGITANAKSLLGVLSLEISKDDTIKIVAEGEDERSAVSGLIDLIGISYEIEEDTQS